MKNKKVIIIIILLITVVQLLWVGNLLYNYYKFKHNAITYNVSRMTTAEEMEEGYQGIGYRFLQVSNMNTADNRTDIRVGWFVVGQMLLVGFNVYFNVLKDFIRKREHQS